MIKQEDLAGNAVALLPHQFADSANLQALIRALVGETTGAQELEDVLWQLLTERALAVATGYRLDEIGVIVGQPREFTDDDSYRALLYGKIGINSSKGTPEQLIAITDRISEPEFVELTERFPACVQVYVHDPLRLVILYRLQQAASAGVKVIAESSGDDNPFVFGVDRDTSGVAHGTELSYGEGWGETTLDEGGTFTEIFEGALPQ